MFVNMAGPLTITGPLTTGHRNPSRRRPQHLAMTNFVCAVADCSSDSRKKNRLVKGWARFPTVKKDPIRRKVWETKCRRGRECGSSPSRRVVVLVGKGKHVVLAATQRTFFLSLLP